MSRIPVTPVPLSALVLVVLAALLAIPVEAAVDTQQSQDFYEDAVERFRSRNFAEAEIQLRNALQRNPDNLPARILFGKTLMETGQPLAAIHEFEKAQSLGGDENLFVVPMANAFLAVATPEEVVKRFRPQNHEGEVAGELYLAIGEAHIQMGDIDAAGSAFQEASARLTLDARPVVGRARIALAKGRRAQADKLLKTAVVLGPELHEVWLLKGIMHRDGGEYDDAREAFERALAIAPDSLRALVARTAMWMDLGDTERARADMERARQLGSETLELIYLNALLLFQEGRADEARELLKARAAEIEQIRKDVRNKLPKVELMLGVVAYFERNYGQSVEHLRRYLENAPGHRGARRYLAGAYLALKEYDNVIALYEGSAGDARARDPLSLALLAEAHRAKGDLARAERYIEDAYRIGPALARVGIRLAMDRLESGRPDKAVEDLEKLAARFPQAVELQGQLARAYAKAGRVAEAKTVSDRLVEASPEDVEVRMLAGAVDLASGDADSARAHFTHASAIDPARVPPRVNLARIDRMQGKLVEAEARYRRILDETPQHATAGVELASLLLARGELDAAARRVDAVIEASPERLDAHRLRVDLLFATGAPRNVVVETVEQVIAQFGTDPEAQLLAGLAYRRLGDRDAAARHLREASARLPARVGPLYALANRQYGLADYEGAEETLVRAGRADPDHLGVLVLRASVSTQRGRFDTAASYVTRARERHGERASIFTVEGDLLMAQSRIDEALVAYQRAYEHSPNPATVATLFRARAANRDVSDAFALMEDWLARNPDDAASRRLYARLLVGERQWARARDAYETLREAGVEDARALNNLAVVYQHLGDPRALETARAAHERAPDNPAVTDTYGWVLAENGDPKQGLNLLRQAFSRLSTEPVIRYHIGIALARIGGRDDEAAEELRAALSQGEASDPWVDDAKRELESLGVTN